MVEFVDGTVLAQLGVTDMRLPIQYALVLSRALGGGHPRAWTSRSAMRLDFDVPDRERFPCLDLAYRALEGGGTLPAVLNAANEEAVAAFLDGTHPLHRHPRRRRRGHGRRTRRRPCARSTTCSSRRRLGPRARPRAGLGAAAAGAWQRIR